MKVQIPDRWNPIVDRFKQIAEQYGYEVYIAGGFVRDLILGEVPYDLDVTIKKSDGTTNLDTAYEFARIVAREYGLNPPENRSNQGTTFLYIGPDKIDFAAPRTDKYYEGDRHPDVEIVDNLKADALRRDVGANALFIDIRNNEVLDLTGHGLKDIEEKMLRVTDPGQEDLIITQDPLRMLRNVRQAIQLGFDIDPLLKEALKRNKDKIKELPGSRLQEELDKMIKLPNKTKTLELLEEIGLLDYLMPEMKAMKGMAQPEEYHHKDVWHHTMLVGQNVERFIPSDATEQEKLILRLAAWLHDIGKAMPGIRTVDEGKIHFLRHDEEGAKKVYDILYKRYNYPLDVVKAVEFLVGEHMRPHSFKGDWSDSAVRRFVSETAPYTKLVLALAKADVTSSRPERVAMNIANIEGLEKRIEEIAQRDKDKASAQKPLFDGNELMQMYGKTGGKWITEVKNWMLEEQQRKIDEEGKEYTKEELKPIMEQFMKEKGIITAEVDTSLVKKGMDEWQYYAYMKEATELEQKVREDKIAQPDIAEFFDWVNPLLAHFDVSILVKVDTQYRKIFQNPKYQKSREEAITALDALWQTDPKRRSSHPTALEVVEWIKTHKAETLNAIDKFKRFLDVYNNLMRGKKSYRLSQRTTYGASRWDDNDLKIIKVVYMEGRNGKQPHRQIYELLAKMLNRSLLSIKQKIERLYKIDPELGPYSFKHWDRDDIIKAIQERYLDAETLNRRLVPWSLRGQIENHSKPKCNTRGYECFFESWDDAMAEAIYALEYKRNEDGVMSEDKFKDLQDAKKYYIRALKKSHQWGKSEILELLKEIHEHNLPATKAFIMQYPQLYKKKLGLNRSLRGITKTVEEIFGTWGNALIDAGIAGSEFYNEEGKYELSSEEGAVAGFLKKSGVRFTRCNIKDAIIITKEEFADLGYKRFVPDFCILDKEGNIAKVVEVFGDVTTNGAKVGEDTAGSLYTEKRQVKIDFYTALYGEDFIYIDVDDLGEEKLEKKFKDVLK